MTSYRRINSRTLNRDVQQQDNMVVFNTPLSRAIYPNYFSVPDASNTCLLVSTGSPYSATASAELTFDGTTLDVSANFEVDGNTHVQKLDISGNLTVQNNILSYGNILAKQFLPGQVVNMVMLNNTELGQTPNPISIASGQTKIIFQINYTPIIANSNILIEYQTFYDMDGGSNADSISAFIYRDNSSNTISYTRQIWNSGGGGGTRSGTVFPIIARTSNINNTSLTPIVIGVKGTYNAGDDTFRIFSDTSTWLKITEIGR